MDNPYPTTEEARLRKELSDAKKHLLMAAKLVKMMADQSGIAMETTVTIEHDGHEFGPFSLHDMCDAWSRYDEWRKTLASR